MRQVFQYLLLLIVAISIISCNDKAKDNTETYTDIRDGKVYKIITIGDQTWFAENFAYKASQGCWAPNDKERNVRTYGYLYNWETADSICPAGWHLPNEYEWNKLLENLRIDSINSEKTKGTSNSSTSFSIFTDENGFGGLFIGFAFSGMSNIGWWWSAMQINERNALAYDFGSADKYLKSIDVPIGYGLSVRYVKNTEKGGNGRLIQKPTEAQLKVIDRLKIQFSDIPAGEFIMGSPLNEPDRGPDVGEADEDQHKVKLHSFKMSKYEITVKQFKEFIDSTGYITDADKAGSSAIWNLIYEGPLVGLLKGVNWKCDVYGNLRKAKQFNQPVIHISWNDAMAFAKWIGCRLPTEAEWEYACRAGTTTAFYTGEKLTLSQANFIVGVSEQEIKTTPVGSYSSNPWGLFDMCGNADEWCSDWYNQYSTKEQTDPMGPLTGDKKVKRGGDSGSQMKWCRSASRSWGGATYSGYDTGFRIVYDN
jgi:formylglycine-generating enzyme